MFICKDYKRALPPEVFMVGKEMECMERVHTSEGVICSMCAVFTFTCTWGSCVRVVFVPLRHCGFMCASTITSTASHTFYVSFHLMCSFECVCLCENCANIYQNPAGSMRMHTTICMLRICTST